MNEVLADLYADTGDKRWLDLSRRFDHHAFLDPLKRREDKLAGHHGNTQVPKMLGVLKQYIYTGEKSDGVAAEFFGMRLPTITVMRRAGMVKTSTLDHHVSWPSALTDGPARRATSTTC